MCITLSVCSPLCPSVYLLACLPCLLVYFPVCQSAFVSVSNLLYLYICLSACLLTYICLSTCMSRLPVCLYVHLILRLCKYVFASLYKSILDASLSACQFGYLPVCLSTCLPIHPSISLSVCLCTYLFVSQNICLLVSQSGFVSL
jgi:hypothetical protein